jgi:hypothetical protein
MYSNYIPNTRAECFPLKKKKKKRRLLQNEKTRVFPP